MLKKKREVMMLAEAVGTLLEHGSFSIVLFIASIGAMFFLPTRRKLE